MLKPLKIILLLVLSSEAINETATEEDQTQNHTYSNNDIHFSEELMELNNFTEPINFSEKASTFTDQYEVATQLPTTAFVPTQTNVESTPPLPKSNNTNTILLHKTQSIKVKPTNFSPSSNYHTTHFATTPVQHVGVKATKTMPFFPPYIKSIDFKNSRLQKTKSIYTIVAEFQNKLATNTSCPEFCSCEVKASTCSGNNSSLFPSLSISYTKIKLIHYDVRILTYINLNYIAAVDISIKMSNISMIDGDAFHLMKYLIRLDLSQNRINSLHPTAFRGLNSLKYLDLSFNLITELGQSCTYLVNLDHLNLKNNQISHLSATIFQGLDKIHYINLENNSIESIDIAAFQHMNDLAHLVLADNQLSNLTRLNFFGSRLQYIDISGIGASSVPQALTQFVRDLRLAKNQIKEIHRGDFDSYPYLGLLVLDDNGLTVLEEDALGRHEYLARLWLSGNTLELIPLSLPSSLEALYLEENKIKEIRKGDLDGLYNLEQLFLQQNKIGEISSTAFKNLTNLKVLDLQANKLTSINPFIFEKLEKLVTLDLSQNRLQSIEQNSFKGLSHLKALRLSRINTNVSMKDASFESMDSLETLVVYGSPYIASKLVQKTSLLSSLRNLRELNVMHNEIISLRQDFPEFFPNMSLIKLSENMWNCSNNIFWMKSWMKTSTIKFHRHFGVRCHYPRRLRGKSVILLKPEDLILDRSNPSSDDKAPIKNTSVSPKRSENSLGKYKLHFIVNKTISRQPSKKTSGTKNNIILYFDPQSHVARYVPKQLNRSKSSHMASNLGNRSTAVMHDEAKDNRLLFIMPAVFLVSGIICTAYLSVKKLRRLGADKKLLIDSKNDIFDTGYRIKEVHSLSDRLYNGVFHQQRPRKPPEIEKELFTISSYSNLNLW